MKLNKKLEKVFWDISDWMMFEKRESFAQVVVQS